MVLHPVAAVSVSEPDVLRSTRQEGGAVPRGIHQVHEAVENLLLQVEPKDETTGLRTPSSRPAVEFEGPTAGQSQRTEPRAGQQDEEV